VKSHQIPTDKSLWLSELGELLDPPIPVGEPASSPAQQEENPRTPVLLPPDLALAPTEPEIVVRVPDHPEPPPAPDLVTTRVELPPTLPDVQLAETHAPVVIEPPPVPAVVAPPEPEPKPEPKPKPEPAPALVPAPIAAAIPGAGWVGARHGSRNAAPAGSESRASGRSEPAGVAVLTPPPAPAPVPAVPTRHRVLPEPVPRSAPIPEASAEPVHLQTQADIAVALTAALTSRMKPPAAPRRDLRPSTAVWMLLTGVGVALVLLALISDAKYRWAVLVVGFIQIAAGYGWIVWLTHRRDPHRGLLCAIPPLTVHYLTQYKYARLRPLRFSATGAGLVLLAALVPALAPHTQALFRRAHGDASTPPDPTTMSKLEQLRYYHDQRSYEPLCKTLDVLAKTDPLLSEDARDRAELAAELRVLCQHNDIGVKVRAMSAYARWDPAGARTVCLAAVRSPSSEERKRALELLPSWRDNDAARAAQSLIGRPGTVETNQAKAVLEEIGGAPAEQAAWALLNRADDQATKLTALSILEKVGSASSVFDLRNYATASDDEPVRLRAFAAADAVQARLRSSNPGP
jgi:hypothetical protein